MNRPLLRCFLLAATLSAVFFSSARAHAQTFPAVWNSTANYQPGDLVTDYGNYYRCIAAVTNAPYRNPSEYYTSWQLFYVRNNTTIPIGVDQTFPNFQVAWNYVQNATIAQGAYLHLNIVTTEGAFKETFSAPLNLDQPCGGSVSIVGESQKSVDFAFTGNGVTLDDGHSLALLQGINISGSAANSTGVAVTGNASMGDLSCAVSGFTTGVSADQGGHIYCDVNTAVSNCITFFSSTRLANLNLEPYVYVNEKGAKAAACGLYAAQGGFIEASSCYIINNQVGAFATEGGIIDCQGSVYGSDTVAVEATMKGHVDCANSVFGYQGSDVHDIDCNTAASVDRTGVTTASVEVGANDGSYVFGP